MQNEVKRNFSSNSVFSLFSEIDFIRIQVQRYSPISVKTDVHDATTSTDDLQQRPGSQWKNDSKNWSKKKQLFSAPRRTRDVGTPTANLPQRPLSRSGLN